MPSHLRVILSGLVSLFVFTCNNKPQTDPALAVKFSGKYGQIEVGGKYAGLEFHHSRPLPSRISFYYPVANSIDLSTDYWKRDESLPLSLLVKVGNRLDSLEKKSISYRYTPYAVAFENSDSLYGVKISYQFCEDLPVIVWRVMLENLSNEVQDFQLVASLRSVLRSCHTYAWIEQSRGEYDPAGSKYVAYYDHSAVDSAAVFMINVSDRSISILGKAGDLENKPAAIFNFQKSLKPKEKVNLAHLIGSGRVDEIPVLIDKSRSDWEKEVKNFENNIIAYATQKNRIVTGDSAIDQTVNWSKAVMMANRHYLNGRFVPMPCPAEYNFFFTHDALLTDLGAVHFDPSRVKNDLLYLLSLTGPDSILPHAYYWKDDGYKTEYCGSDNWNHFWFLLLSNTYFLHTRDSTTIGQIMPVLEKSIQMTMKNKKADDLMYATRPDWWDIGNLYGARAYVTILMIKTLQDFAVLKAQLFPEFDPSPYLQTAQRMTVQLENILWDEDSQYLLNMLEPGVIDHHYYAGSLLAVMFNILPQEKSGRLIQTAQRELLDQQLGIRIAMPADFHELGSLYHFQGMEMGAPYIYINGGIWPQGNIWYGLALLNNGQADRSLEVLKKYLTLEGIHNSPLGQPSFYEYRNADVHSRNYGQIDKPTFLWAGGLYLYYLYQLIGLQQTAFNLTLHSDIPETFTDLTYQSFIMGKSCQFELKGEGNYFSEISWDGQPVNSAVIFRAAEKISVIRGYPEQPYLAEINGLLQQVNYDPGDQQLRIQVSAWSGHSLEIVVVSPIPLIKVLLNEQQVTDINCIISDEQVSEYQIRAELKTKENKIVCQF